MKSPITTHVLDTAKGAPASGVPVKLFYKKEKEWDQIAHSQTDDDGRIIEWFSRDNFYSGHYRIIFEVSSYLNDSNCFFPEVSIDFNVEKLDQHYHVPLLLSPFGYSTYRGS